MNDSRAQCRIVRLRGLPYEALEHNIRTFFDGYELLAIHLLQRSGKPTGEAYVEFKDAMVAERALRERQKEHIGSRYIEIFEASEANLVSEASTNNKALPTLSGYVIRLRGLPFSSSADDVLKFFGAVTPTGGAQGVLFTCTSDGRPTGEAFLEFDTEEAAKAALARNKEQLGTRYVEIFPSSKGELWQAAHHRGFFTAVGGHRRYHPPLPPGAAAALEQAAAGHAGIGLSRIRTGTVPRADELAQAFGLGLNLSHQSLAGTSAYGASGQGQYMGGMHSGVRTAANPWMLGSQASGFSPAPGASGTGRAGHHGGGSGGAMSPYAYNRQSVVMTPFMMQHPFMGAAQTQTWGAPGYHMAAQQQAAAAAAAGAAAWYSGTPQGVLPYNTAPGYTTRMYYGASPQQPQQQPQQLRGGNSRGYRNIPSSYSHGPSPRASPAGGGRTSSGPTFAHGTTHSAGPRTRAPRAESVGSADGTDSPES